MVDRDRALTLIDGVRAALADLDRYASTVDLPRLRSDPDAQNMVLYAVYRAAQGAIDLAHHIVSDEALTVATTYRAAFHTLSAAGWIDADLASRLAERGTRVKAA